MDLSSAKSPSKGISSDFFSQTAETSQRQRDSLYTGQKAPVAVAKHQFSAGRTDTVIQTQESTVSSFIFYKYTNMQKTQSVSPPNKNKAPKKQS